MAILFIKSYNTNMSKKHHPHNQFDKYSGHKEKPNKPVPPFATFKFKAIGLLIFLLLALFGISILGFFEIKYSDRFYPGIFVNNESVGGKTYTEVLNYFREKAEELQKNGLDINFESSKGIRKVNIPMFATGLTSDNSVEYFSLGNWENDLRNAYSWGHQANFFRSLKEKFALIFAQKNFNFSANIQKEAVNSLLENELYNFFKLSIPARFSSDKNKISILKEKAGENIDKEEVINIIKNKLNQFDSTPITFKARADMPKVAETDLEPFLYFAENLAKKINLVFQYQGRKWTIKGPKLISWLTIKKEGGIGIDGAILEEYLTNTIARFINNPPQNSRFKMQDGKLIEIVPGKSGNAVDIDKTVQKIEKIIPEIEKTFARNGNFLSAAALNAVNSEANFNPKNGTIYLPLEIIKVEPKVTKETVDKYKINDLVREARTSFEGSSADREHNIKIGAAAINGILIAPGAEFSTVSSIGRVTEKEGYVKELVIKENRTIKELGGGLCQIATTLFRLALNAGLNITERQNHRFTVQYYDPPGLDATIYGPHPDLRFVNDTGNYLLLQTRVENKQVIMELYGQKDGRSVEISEATLYNKIPAPETMYIQSEEIPVGETKCFEAPHDGITTDVLYTVSYSDGTINSINFRSIYQPWQKKCLVGAILPNPLQNSQ
ncbi:MAG: VanW family protein [Candidatus Nomurabacteria bacterium GW2011_GWB1_37_5]|uniref:VanW family protein n=1 Tax=Candidatus Nomurabacteria bacterium GW2011_GWB1_37_5 TaxID=1618742 RepID=A0A0G0GYG3_9BACT|nr:MAG: VanW family protein [Candidatus Nomurabacteria bacterium GW2011_GWB1_37_5]